RRLDDDRHRRGLPSHRHRLVFHSGAHEILRHIVGTITTVITAWFVGALVLFVVGRQLVTRRRTRERVFEQLGEDTPGTTPEPEDEQGFLERWLSLAGFRGPAAVPVFLISTLVGLGLGLFLAYTLIRVGAVPQLARALGRVPGGVGDIFLPLIYAVP